MKPFVFSNRATTSALNLSRSRWRRGATNTLALGVAAAAVAAGAIFYFASDPFGAKVDETVRQATKWTPENIQKNPTGYFTWAIAELKKQQQKLKANIFAITVEKEKSKRAAAEHTAKADTFQKTIDDAKAAFKALPDEAPAAAGKPASKKFPLTWKGITFQTQRDFQFQVLQADNKRKNAQVLADQHKTSARKLETFIAQLQEKENETALKLETATSQVELLKAKKTIDGIGEIGNSINDLLVKTDVLVSQSDAGKISISDIAAEGAISQKSGQSDADFDALMK
jgi:septal ring factor EnvC (AmiA/AmiB activator)